MSTTSRHSLSQLLEPVVLAGGLDLEDVQVVPAGKRRLLRVVVDRDGGVSLDDVAAVSSSVSARLEDSGAMGGTPYVLEVTSPGVDRPLTEARHWRRAKGRLVAVTLTDGTRVQGRVRGADDTGLELDVDTADVDTAGVADVDAGVKAGAEGDGGAQILGWESVRDGRVQVEFSAGKRAQSGRPGDVEQEA